MLNPEGKPPVLVDDDDDPAMRLLMHETLGLAGSPWWRRVMGRRRWRPSPSDIQMYFCIQRVVGDAEAHGKRFGRHWTPEIKS